MRRTMQQWLDCLPLLLARLDAGEPLDRVAVDYGVLPSRIRQVITTTGKPARQLVKRAEWAQRIPAIVARQQAGESLSRIAADFGVVPERVRQVLMAAGIRSPHPPPPPWAPARDAELRTLWAEGLPASVIARHMLATKHAVVGRARRLHLPSRPSPIRRKEAAASQPIGEPVRQTAG